MHSGPSATHTPVDRVVHASEKTPYLSEQERLTLGISSPDNEIKSARHSMQHLLNAAPEVYVIHATKDDLAHPSFILDEWLSQRPDHDPKYLETKSEPTAHGTD